MIVDNTMNGTHYIHIRCDVCGCVASTFNKRGKKYKIFNNLTDAIANAKQNDWQIKGGKMVCKICGAKE